jgi:hypothetical protein
MLRDSNSLHRTGPCFAGEGFVETLAEKAETRDRPFRGSATEVFVMYSKLFWWAASCGVASGMWYGIGEVILHLLKVPHWH